MWPFEKRRRREATRRGPRLADNSAYARCFAQLGDSAYCEVVRVYQLGYLRPSDKGRMKDWRPLLRLPLLQLVVEPGESIDFADPVSGFPGIGHRPARERVLRLWADDLLSISHGSDWTFVIDAKRPFERPWLDLLAPPLGATYEFWHAVVSASFAGPTPEGWFRMADVDATTYTTRVHIEDRRDDAPCAGLDVLRAADVEDSGADSRPPGRRGRPC